MSKSRGNDVDPVDIASRLGGEIVRQFGTQANSLQSPIEHDERSFHQIVQAVGSWAGGWKTRQHRKFIH